jgi:hypothetical protein
MCDSSSHRPQEFYIYSSCSKRVLNWGLLVKDFAPEWHFCHGKDNTEADTFSCHPILDQGENQYPSTHDRLDAVFNECMLNYPINVDEFPLDSQQIHEEQVDYATIMALPDGNRLTIQVYNGTDLICRHDDNNQWKIVILPSLIDDTIEWYHAMLNHCGATRMVNTMKTHIYFPQMQQLIVDYVHRCDACQHFKNSGRGAVHVPPCEDILAHCGKKLHLIWLVLGLLQLKVWELSMLMH